jgi:formylmethanofuran dehydrogenase subunit B
MSVTYASGAPQYRPAGRDPSYAAEPSAVLVVGAAAAVGESLRAIADRSPVVIVGPRASEAPFAARVAVDTGIAGIHEGGTAYRMDDTPLRLRPPLQAERSAAAVLSELLAAVQARRPGAAR